MRSFAIWKPEKPTNQVLVFLHGVGEAFFPVDLKGDLEAELERLKVQDVYNHRAGLKNLFNHGIPRILGAPEAAFKLEGRSLPLFGDFAIIAPQTLLREDIADASKRDGLMEEVDRLATAIAGEGKKVALVGFSRGGYAAILRAAQDPKVVAVVTMDAAMPDASDSQALQAAVGALKAPCWMFYADYDGVDAGWDKKITDFHACLPAAKIGEAGRPPKGKSEAKFKTLVSTAGSRNDRHVRVCNAVCARSDVYEWLAEQFA